MLAQDRICGDTMENLAAHQKRVVDERDSLNDKLWRLQLFTDTRAFDELPIQEREDLLEQYKVMDLYLHILDRRIGRFSFPDS